jgi:quercetin dioxygenase-like cupin family protein
MSLTRDFTRGVLPKGTRKNALSHLSKAMPKWPSLTAATIALLTLAIAVEASAGEIHGKKLLAQQFDARPVSQVEIGDFHFTAGQTAPLHTHVAPVFGYVSKGSIYYQVEGLKPQLLKAGDAFYEPAGPNILHFDNPSKTEEAVFTDFNFERTGEPFIVFPAPLTVKIDRRSFPTETLDGTIANTMEVYEQSLSPSEGLDLPAGTETAYVYVAEGSVSVQVCGQAPIVYLPGQTFYEPKPGEGTRVANASKSLGAKVITFHLTSNDRSSN